MTYGGPRLGWGIGFLVLSGLAALGCASADDASTASDFGGQTGSLIPDCRLEARAVPSGEAAFVVRGEEDSCAEVLAQSELLDASGAPVAFAYEQIDQNVRIAVSEQQLAPGSYSVVVGATEPTPLTITTEAPVPEALGELQIDSDFCRLTGRLVFDASLLPYLGLVQLEARVNGGASVVLAPYGTLEAGGHQFPFALAVCEPAQCSLSPAEITITAFIAGQPRTDLEATTFADVACDVPSDEPACAYAAGSHQTPRGLILVSLLSLAAVTRRRRLGGANATGAAVPVAFKAGGGRRRRRNGGKPRPA